MILVAIILAALAALGTGALWYRAFGPRWIAAARMTEDQRKANQPPLRYGIGAVAAVASSGMLAHVFVSSHVGGLVPGLVGGLGIGIFVVAPWLVLVHAFAGRPRDLWWIDGGYVAVSLGVIGAVLGLFV